jgi:hypothetical protein
VPPARARTCFDFRQNTRKHERVPPVLEHERVLQSSDTIQCLLKRWAFDARDLWNLNTRKQKNTRIPSCVLQCLQTKISGRLTASGCISVRYRACSRCSPSLALLWLGAWIFVDPPRPARLTHCTINIRSRMQNLQGNA